MKTLRELPKAPIESIALIINELNYVKGYSLRSIEASWQRNYPNPLSKEEVEQGKAWSKHEEILFDALWADPHDGLGSKRSERGKVAVMLLGAKQLHSNQYQSNRYSIIANIYIYIKLFQVDHQEVDHATTFSAHHGLDWPSDPLKGLHIGSSLRGLKT